MYDTNQSIGLRVAFGCALRMVRGLSILILNIGDLNWIILSFDLNQLPSFLQCVVW